MEEEKQAEEKMGRKLGEVKERKEGENSSSYERHLLSVPDGRHYLKKGRRKGSMYLQTLMHFWSTLASVYLVAIAAVEV